MRQIKFRGRRIDTGEYVYGDVLHVAGKPAVIRDKYNFPYKVYPDTVAQLGGYDLDDKEFYEGDTVWNHNLGNWQDAQLINSVGKNVELKESCV